MSKTVAVAMSGGVDSSVAAKLLLDQGYKVIGLTLRLWGAKLNDAGQSVAEIDAKKIAEMLNIPHFIIDCQQYFRESVVENFISEYALARTPNPCVNCNKLIKFGLLFEEAMLLGADYLATGHYVQKFINPITKTHYLQQATDKSKDQTYVLYNIKSTMLEKLIFPLGAYSKTEVRALAEQFNLPVFAKADSQEICFIPNDNYRDFLAKHSNIKPLKGNFVDINGNILGEHQGLVNYTIGQRKGFNIAFGKKMYVLRLDKSKNQVVLADNSEVFAQTLKVTDIVFVDERNLNSEYVLQVKIRYNAKPALAKIIVKGTTADIVFDQPQRAITPGQSAAFYEGDILVGGGIIEC